MTRDKSQVWNYFKVVDNSKKNAVVKCNYCPQTYSSNAGRMEKHLAHHCKACPETIKAMFVSTVLNSELQENSSSSPTSSSVTAVKQFVGSSKQNMLQPKINYFLDNLPKEKQIEIDVALARAIFASGAPLSLIDNYYCKQFFLLIRPHYKPPSRYRISEKLLNNEHDRINKLAMEKIESADSLTLLCLGGRGTAEGDHFQN